MLIQNDRILYLKDSDGNFDTTQTMEVKFNKFKKQLALYIVNKAFGDLRKFRVIFKHRQIVDLSFKNE